MELAMTKFNRWLAEAKLDTKTHQAEGMRWILQREFNPTIGPAGGFLCDEMGLGKTILMIGAIMSNFQERTLIVLPLSLLEQWRSVIAQFCGHEPIVYHGPGVKKITINALKTAPVVITTYGMISARKKIGYRSPLWDIHWSRIICDEGHHMRNTKTGVFKGAMNLKGDIKWIVTGTPINNAREDFFNLCQIQGLGKILLEIYNSMKGDIKKFKAKIQECVLKRTKAQVGIKMPPLKTEIVPVFFQHEEEEIFVKNVHRLVNFATVKPENVNTLIEDLTGWDSILPVFQLMKQSCIMPEEACNNLKTKKLWQEIDAETLEELDCPTNSKIMTVVDKIVRNRCNRKRKLVFCTYRREIEILAKQLKNEGLNCGVMNGSSTKKQRKIVLSDKTLDVLVVQIQTACEGLNLQHFSEIHFTSPHWNPAVEDQAIARAHRIGQEDKVIVYKYVTVFGDKAEGDKDSTSLDQYCLTIQEKKRELAKMI